MDRRLDTLAIEQKRLTTQLALDQTQKSAPRSIFLESIQKLAHQNRRVSEYPDNETADMRQSERSQLLRRLKRGYLMQAIPSFFLVTPGEGRGADAVAPLALLTPATRSLKTMRTTPMTLLGTDRAARKRSCVACSAYAGRTGGWASRAPA